MTNVTGACKQHKFVLVKCRETELESTPKQVFHAILVMLWTIMDKHTTSAKFPAFCGAFTTAGLMDEWLSEHTVQMLTIRRVFLTMARCSGRIIGLHIAACLNMCVLYSLGPDL
jgi:cytochrome b